MFWMAWLACADPAPEGVWVVAAARDLSVGVAIAEDDIRMVQVDPKKAPPGVFVNPDAVIGRKPQSVILATEVIRSGRLADAKLQQQLEQIVPPELEVITARLDSGQTAPEPGVDRVEVWRVKGNSATQIATDVAVFRIDGDRVALMADDAQREAITAPRGSAELVVRVPPRPLPAP